MWKEEVSKPGDSRCKDLQVVGNLQQGNPGRTGESRTTLWRGLHSSWAFKNNRILIKTRLMLGRKITIAVKSQRCERVGVFGK